MIEQNTSTLSKRFKTPEQKAQKAARNRENGILRANLHKQKATAGNAGKRAEIQGHIDEISKRK